MAIDQEMKARLVSSTRAKIARADEHLATLYRETDRWGEGYPFRLVRQSNADGSKHLFSLRYEVQPDVWRWAVLLGDALHNLRGALDHMVYALAINQTGTDPPNDDATLAFPICSEPKYFTGAKFRIRSLNEATQAAIEKTQPYKRIQPGQWFQPLWFLSQLHDIDKHRLAHLTAVAAKHDEIVVDAEPGTFTAEWNIGPLVDGAPLFRLTLSKPDPDVHVYLKPTGAVVLNFVGMPPIGLHPTTKHMRREVVLICRYLSRCFV